MITYVDSSNLEKYEILFDRATDLLKGDEENWDANDEESLFGQFCIVNSNLSVNEAKEAFKNYRISSLNEYFAYLSTIANMQEDQLSDEDKAYFLSLPLDEDTFNIDANSRVITVPASFARNGIGIQSDELAEIIYFAIDRYFDSTDLASDDLSIAIQWEKGNESGLCRNYGKFLTGTQGKQKLIFGWPITTTLTKTPGVINFAVRIYALNENNFKYSFMTLPAAVQIKESLKSGGDDKAAYVADADIEDASSKILNRIVNSTGVYDEYSPAPDIPVVTKDIHFYELDLDGENYGQAIEGTSHDLAENENINLAISAKPGDSGILHYVWHKIPFNETTGVYDSADVTLTTQTKVEPVRDTGAIVEGQQYYSKDQNDVYTIIENPSAGDEKYIKIARISAAAGDAPAGEYYPEVQAKLLVNSSSTSKEGVAKVTIPGPVFPNIQGDSEQTIHVIKGTQENPNAVTITGNKITVTGDGAYLEAELEGLEDELEANSNYETDEMETSLTPVFEFTQEAPDKSYKINAYATRNKATVKTPGNIIYRVTALPQAFSIGNNNGSNYDSELNMGRFKAQDNKEANIIVRSLMSNRPYIVDTSVLHDHCYYAWIDTGLEIAAIPGSISDTDVIQKAITYVAENGEFDTLINNIALLQGVDDTALRGLFGAQLIKLGEIDFEQQTIVDGVLDSELAEKYKTWDKGDASSYDLVICLVINALNGRYAAAASTFYLV